MNNINQFFYNLRYFLFSRKAYKKLNALQENGVALNYELTLLRYKDSDDEDVRLAYEYLRKRPFCTELFPYEKKRDLPDFDVRFDKELKMHYVMHNGRPLFYPKDMAEDNVREAYRFVMEDDDIIGNGYRERNPHAYQSERYHIGEGDVLIDAGSAEGLLALDVIDRVDKVCLVECDSRWWKPLEATFAPYKEKVEIVKSPLMVSSHGKAMGLADLLERYGNHRVFVKMDIEGSELEVLRDAQNYLKYIKMPIALAVCAYHHTNDYESLLGFFDSIGYHTETQPGFMYTNFGDGRGMYTLRRGMIRASNV